MPARAPDATCQGAPMKYGPAPRRPALAATVTSVTRLRPKPAIRPMNRAVKAKSAPRRSGSPRKEPSDGAERRRHVQFAQQHDAHGDPIGACHRPIERAALGQGPGLVGEEEEGEELLRPRHACTFGDSDAPMSTWRALISSVAKASAAIGRRMDPGLDGGELRPAGEHQRRHQRDLERRQPFRGSHGAEQQADRNGRDDDGRDVAQGRPVIFAAMVDGEGVCSVHGHALRPRPYAGGQAAVLDESAADSIVTGTGIRRPDRRPASRPCGP